jgi:predicted N-acyltransferase
MNFCRSGIINPLIANQLDDYIIVIGDQATALDENWDFVADTPLISKTFLSAIEKVAPIGMKFAYVQFLDRDGHPIAIFYFQIVPFQADQSLNYQKNGAGETEKCPSFFMRTHQMIRSQIAKNVGFSTLVCGNLLLTGSYGWSFALPFSLNEKQLCLAKAFDDLSKWLTKTGRENPPVQLIKEFYAYTQKPQNHFPGKQKWHGFRIQPNHIFNIRTEWIDFKMYLDALSSKYRVRYRRAKKKLEGIEIVPMDLDMILQHREEIYNLYLQIAVNAGFNMVNLHSDYLIEIKRYMGDQFQVFGYMKDQKLCGFFSYLDQDKTLDIHYIGLDKDLNIKHQLYLNMLYYIIELGIQESKTQINFGRTAPEIKSSVGAETVNMDCFIRHQSPLVHKTIPLLIQYLQPKETWVERQPFLKWK